MRVRVITISDRATRGDYEDRSGPAIEEALRERIDGVEVERVIVPDEPDAIRDALEEGLPRDVIITTGGTGIGPRDITPDITAAFCDKLLPGISEILRSESYKQTSRAMLSRGVAGVKGQTVVVNVPGSVRGARFCAEIVAPVLGHAGEMLRGGDHG
jgi:molybdopterin adenylyltransferase